LSTDLDETAASLERFAPGDGAAWLLAGNALHADFTPEANGSGLFGWVLCGLGQQHGFPTPEGGAGRLTEALVSRLRAHGGRVECGVRVERVLIRRGVAVGVRAADGREISAGRAVLAGVVAPVLYRDLVGLERLPLQLVSDLRGFQRDSSTVKVDWSLDAPIPWTADDARRAGTVHVADGVDALTRSTSQLARGLIPDQPFLVMGQYSMVDQTRHPPGKDTAWAYTHVPQRVKGDAGGGDLTGRWDEPEAAAFADRVENEVERRAPGFRALVRARHIFTPPTLEAANARRAPPCGRPATWRGSERQPAAHSGVQARTAAEAAVDGALAGGFPQGVRSRVGSRPRARDAADDRHRALGERSRHRVDRLQDERRAAHRDPGPARSRARDGGAGDRIGLVRGERRDLGRRHAVWMGEVAPERRVDGARPHDGDTDLRAGGAQLGAQALDERVERALRSDVWRQQRQSDAVDRRADHHEPAGRTLEMRQDGANGVDGTAEADPYAPVEVLGRDLLEPTERAGRRRDDDHVEPAERSCGLLDGGTQLVPVADVGGDDDGARALGSDSPRDLLQPRAAACQ
jgi:hypothetical protein